MVAVTEDGRVANGILVEEDAKIVVLRDSNGQDSAIPRGEIQEMAQQPKSLMPEGLLDGLSEQQMRDLFAYLRCTQPLND